MSALSSFPFLSRSEFRDACHSLENRVDNLRSAVSSQRQSRDADHSGHGEGGNGRLASTAIDDDDAVRLHGWNDVKVDERNDQTVLIISKFVDAGDTSFLEYGNGGNGGDEDEIEFEDDPEALVRPQISKHKLNVEYNIILSPTYQVPVLYFSLRDAAETGHAAAPSGLDAVYNHLVPSQFKSNLRNVGIMGGISIDNHPISGIPTYFVHPCNTADALGDVAGSDEPTAESYMFLWLGLVGACVGLHVPSALFAEPNVR